MHPSRTRSGRDDARVMTCSCYRRWYSPPKSAETRHIAPRRQSLKGSEVKGDVNMTYDTTGIPPTQSYFNCRPTIHVASKSSQMGSSGVMNPDALLSCLAGRMSNVRRMLVDDAFDRLDTSGTGCLAFGQVGNTTLPRHKRHTVLPRPPPPPPRKCIPSI